MADQGGDKTPIHVDTAAAAAVDSANREPRKFFPRVKMLLSSDYEPVRYIHTLLACVGESLFRKTFGGCSVVSYVEMSGWTGFSSVSQSSMLTWMLFHCLVLPRLTYYTAAQGCLGSRGSVGLSPESNSHDHECLASRL
jgi:hypothetical protein